MSTKINVRSPFYISYATPVAPTPEFVAATANLRDFSVNAEGDNVAYFRLRNY